MCVVKWTSNDWKDVYRAYFALWSSGHFYSFLYLSFHIRHIPALLYLPLHICLYIYMYIFLFFLSPWESSTAVSGSRGGKACIIRRNSTRIIHIPSSHLWLLFIIIINFCWFSLFYFSFVCTFAFYLFIFVFITENIWLIYFNKLKW